MKKTMYILPILIAAAVLLFSAGCVSEEPLVKTTETEIPAEMYQALEDLAGDLSSLERAVLTDLTELSASIKAAGSDEEVKQMLSAHYAEHPCITAIIFRDAVHSEYTSVPVFVDVDLSSYSVNLTEQDFRDAGGLIVRNNVFTKYHGYQNLYYKAVYSADGTYHGYLIFVADVYSMLYLHPSLIETERSYDKYICFIADGENNILYSSIEEAAGEVITKTGYYDGLAYVPYAASGDGACIYTSAGFYKYDSAAQTEKITAWHKLYSTHGHDYTLYLISELNQPELQMDNVFQTPVLQALNDTQGAFIYASQNGKAAIMQRVAEGYYETPISVMSMDGTGLASSRPMAAGLNYLNTRGVYGISYVEAAILAAEQGGGYVYYLSPVERVVSPRAAEYTLGIVMPVDGYYIYGEVAGLPDALRVKKEVRPDLTLTSRAILEEASDIGVDAVAKKINENRDKGSGLFIENLTTPIADIAILDVEGNVYASIQHPELIGKSATFMTDVYGGSTTRRTGMLAKTGGGMMDRLLPDEEKEGNVILELGMVEPIDEKYYIYTASVSPSFEDLLTPCLKLSTPTA